MVIAGKTWIAFEPGLPAITRLKDVGLLKYSFRGPTSLPSSLFNSGHLIRFNGTLFPDTDPNTLLPRARDRSGKRTSVAERDALGRHRGFPSVPSFAPLFPAPVSR
jgi:hypothetical protein